MLEILDSEYIKFAPVKGLSETLVLWKHAVRNALIPLLTFSGISLAGLLNGAIVVEVIFAWPGLGRLMLDGVLARDFPIVQAAVLASAFFYVITALVVDILYSYENLLRMHRFRTRHRRPRIHRLQLPFPMFFEVFFFILELECTASTAA